MGTGRAQDSQSGPPPGLPQMAGRQACPPPAGWLRDAAAGCGGGRPGRPGVTTFGSFALHGPPPQEREGGKHQGPAEIRPRSGGATGPRGAQCHPAAGTGRPAAGFPEMVVGGGGGRLSPHPSRSPPPGSAMSAVGAPGPGPGRAGSPVCYMVQKVRPEGGVGVEGVLPPESPTSPVRVQAPNWAPSRGLHGPWVRAQVP